MFLQNISTSVCIKLQNISPPPNKNKNYVPKMYSSSANLYVLQVDLILDAQPSTHTSTSQE